mmetsp:Transcript_17474/g.33127  ORF Transcript_17474/g.33127 Transcript_17474/m.33127 type:complete len:372 (-) Transcript_17474:2192-3307(-)
MIETATSEISQLMEKDTGELQAYERQCDVHADEQEHDSDLSIDDDLLEDSNDETRYQDGNIDECDDAAIMSRTSSGGQIELLELMEKFYRIKQPLSTKKSIHERLYMKGEISAARKAKAFQLKKQEELQVIPPKLELSTRSYTPLRERTASNEKPYDRLYKSGLQKKEQAILEEAKIEAYNVKHTVKQNTVDSAESTSRLYSRSLKYVEEGKKIRQEIEKKKRRDPTPSRSISISKAQKIYERGLQFKADREKKIQEIINAPRESSFPKMRTQTPRSRGRLHESRDDPCKSRSSSSAGERTRRDASVSRRDVRSQSTSRYRSQSASRISGRKGDRSLTPCRRASDRTLQSTYTSVKSPRIPRSFQINRSDS